MRDQLKVLFFWIVILGSYSMGGSVLAQGCSDAGFCTLGSMKPQHQDSAMFKNKLSLLLPYGLGDANVYVFTPGLQYEREFSKYWSIQAKVTANVAKGDLGTISGLGDLFLLTNYTRPLNATWKVTGTLGGKAPSNLGDLNQGTVSKTYPMQYQSSLGTIDLILGISVRNEMWLFAAGYQQPLTGTNRNYFLPVYWSNTEQADHTAKFAPTNDFYRQPDALLRADYFFQIHHKLKMTGGLLGIYHLGEDTYMDANISNSPRNIQGSSGLTLNATFSAAVALSKHFDLRLLLGTPLVVREVRPDGLTRSFVISPEITYKF